MLRQHVFIALVALVAGLAGCEKELLSAGQAGCKNGSDCSEGLKCVGGICQPRSGPAASCADTDDLYEPNDSLVEAAVLEVGAGLRGLRLCDGDEDWFSIEGVLAEDILRIKTTDRKSVV